LNVYGEITAEVNPTEDADKVLKAVHNIFPKAVVRRSDDKVIGYIDSLEGLEKLRMMIRSRRIRNTVRTILMKHIENNQVVIYLNKQAAYVGKLSFYEAGEVMALGTIKAKIQADNVIELIKWLTD